MTAQTTTTITLNPATESETIRQYEQDKGWRKLSETTTAFVFETTSPYIVMESVYIPSRKEKANETDN